MEMNEWTPAQFIVYIDDQYAEAKKKKVSRLSVDWGTWSRKMNLVLKRKTEIPNHDDEMPTRYKYVFAYWLLKSELLELHYRHKLTRLRKKKSTVEKCKEVRDIIINDTLPTKIQSMKTMMKQTIGESDYEQTP